MAEIKKKLELVVDIDNPVEEIKECVVAISMFHGPQQLDVLKEIELWLGKTIGDAEARQLNTEQETQGPA
ncbi:hypothetical protein BK133_05045 [Paenibacillus sp. FSL H8-0548]|uniref:hypothetical protein n=1 Tax=Paenibacillus sp. FSL H8-0548 TaxID=1920422 RepID=UPI00096CAA53|nr:hypothetical protein [Paenibacillus sp. FSL H8-0548]OMF37423.1 hypothetical protein BK133_05045 [Paenibacillus sp. FSL H8-0548]